MKLLAVGGEEAVWWRLGAALRSEGCGIEFAGLPAAADALLRAGRFDAVLLELVGPACQGLDWLRELRARRSRQGVLTLTALEDVEARIAALRAGADDHAILPVDPREVLARCEALQQRAASSVRNEALRCGELVIDSRKREVRHGATPIDLTPREWSILEILILHIGSAVTKARMLRALTGWDEELAPNAIEVYVSRLRAKLNGTGVRISTVRSIGYRFEHPDDQALPAAGA